MANTIRFTRGHFQTTPPVYGRDRDRYGNARLVPLAPPLRRALSRRRDCRCYQHCRRPETAPNLVSMLADPTRQKIFHFGRFDIAVLFHTFGVTASPSFCTKIASRLARTYTDRHGLKDNLKELLDIDISKQQQSSDWAADILSPAQLEYAASDVLHLHALRDKLTARLLRDGRMELAEACFSFLPTRAKLDLLGWEETDIFAHS